MRIGLLLLLASATPLGAQGVVSPRHFTNAEGNSYSFDGFGTALTPNRYVAIHDDLRGTPIAISSVAFRRDGGSGFTSTDPACSILFDLLMSTAATTPAAPNANFDANHGPNKQQVATLRGGQFPQTVPGHMPRPWEYVLFLDQPYSHTGAGALCLELKINSRNNTTAIGFDWVNGSHQSPAPLYRTVGTGCRHTATGTRLTLNGSSSANWSQSTVSLGLNGTNARPSSTVWGLIGVSDATLGGIPLPLELPGTAASPSGPCSIYNDVWLTLAALSTPSGAVTVNLGIGVNVTFNGLSVFSQLLELDAAANNWGFVLSNGLQHHILAPYPVQPVGEVYNNSSLGATGTVRAGSGLVTKFN